MTQENGSIPYEDDSWREIMRYGERTIHQLGIQRDVRLTSDEWHALICCILRANHRIQEREGISLQEVAEACGNYDD